MSRAATRVAIIGCGVIAPVYAKTLARLGDVELVACADGVPARAEQFAHAHGGRAMDMAEILDDPTIDAVVNLTPPLAHAQVSSAALSAGKATFSEKPLAVHFPEGQALVQLAAERGVRFGCAPDTFLGAGLQTARASIDRGDIGEPVAACAFMLGAGPERWHPNPEFFYQHGAGPLFDMGPYYLTALVQLLGPAASVTASGRATSERRTIHSKDRRGEEFGVEIPTHVSSLVSFADGPMATVVTSFDAQATEYRNIEIYGTEGTLAVPDPNRFGGLVRIRAFADRDWREVEMLRPNIPQQRGIGLADMLWAQRTGRPHRASADLALHVLEIMTAAIDSAASGRRIDLATTCAPSAPLPCDLPANTFDD